MSKRTVAAIFVLLAVASIPFALQATKERRSRFGSTPDQVAVVTVTGAIESATVGGTDQVGQLISFLQDVREEPNVRAVVVRLDTPGGSAAMAQELHRAIVKLREADKPVVVSMGNMAASAGYYIATAADRILVNPSTLTGSIGVISRYINFSGFAEEHGFTYETIATGPYKDIGNPTRPMTDDERTVMLELMDDTLDEFIRVVVEGRGLSEDVVRALADGRLYTGRQAVELGLADDYGGLEESISLAADLAGIDGEPRVFRHTRRVPWYERYLGRMFSGARFSSGPPVTFDMFKQAVENPDVSLWY